MSKRVNDNIRELPTRAREVADGALRALRDQARRPDRVGEVTHRTWELVHVGVGVAARSLSRLERAVQPPARAMMTPRKTTRQSSRTQARPATPRRTKADRVEKPNDD
jgi:hypothetical protein